MEPTKTRAIILKTLDFSETSQIITTFTLQAGRLGLIAKGSRRLKGPFGGSLEPLTLNEIGYVARKTSSLATLTERKLLDDFRDVRTSMRKLYAASVAQEFLLATTQENLPDEKIFGLLETYLRALCASENERILMIAFLLKGLAYEGFTPSLRACAGCGCTTDSRKTHVFSATAGGVTCPKCRPRDRSFDLSETGRKIMIKLLRSSLSEVAGIGVPWNFYLEIKNCLIYYIKSVIERGLRSLETSGGVSGL